MYTYIVCACHYFRAYTNKELNYRYLHIPLTPFSLFCWALEMDTLVSLNLLFSRGSVIRGISALLERKSDRLQSQNTTAFIHQI